MPPLGNGVTWIFPPVLPRHCTVLPPVADHDYPSLSEIRISERPAPRFSTRTCTAIRSIIAATWVITRPSDRVPAKFPARPPPYRESPHRAIRNPSSMNNVSTKDARPSRPESANASASETRKRSPPDRLRVARTSSPISRSMICSVRSDAAPRASLIPRAQRVEVIVGQLDQMIERDALYKAAEAIAVCRADGIIDGLPNRELGSSPCRFPPTGLRLPGVPRRLATARPKSRRFVGASPRFPSPAQQWQRSTPPRRLFRRTLQGLYSSRSAASGPRAGIVHGPIDLLNSCPERSAHGWISGNERGNLIKRPRNALTGRVECLFG